MLVLQVFKLIFDVGSLSNITFIPLGGVQRVGASCYYLNINGANILLDAGTGVDGDIEFKPDFHCLKTSPFV